MRVEKKYDLMIITPSEMDEVISSYVAAQTGGRKVRGKITYNVSNERNSCQVTAEITDPTIFKTVDQS